MQSSSIDGSALDLATAPRAMMGDETATLPASWSVAKIDEVGSVRLGRQRAPSQMTGRYATPYLGAGNIAERGVDLSDVLEMDFTPGEREVYALADGDLVLAEASGSAHLVGRAAAWRDELPVCCFQNTVIRFRPHATDPEYALAVFHHYAASGVFARAARGIGLLHLGAARFSELPFPLPPLAEQERIAAALSSRLHELDQARVALQSALAGTHEQDAEILAAAARGTASRCCPRRPARARPSRDPAPCPVGHVNPSVSGRSRVDLAGHASNREFAAAWTPCVVR